MHLTGERLGQRPSRSRRSSLGRRRFLATLEAEHALLPVVDHKGESVANMRPAPVTLHRDGRARSRLRLAVCAVAILARDSDATKAAPLHVVDASMYKLARAALAAYTASEVAMVVGA